jgi:predicted PurR-regulated permease PerM
MAETFEIRTRTVVKVLAITTLFVGMIYVARLAEHELIWIATAFFLALALNPAVERVSRYMPWKSRGLATASVFLAGLALIAGLIAVFVPPLVSQTDSLVKNYPRYINNIQHSNNFVGHLDQRYHFVKQLNANQHQIESYLTKASKSLVSVVKQIFSSLLATLVVLSLTFFMLIEGPGWMQAVWRKQPPGKRDHRKLLAHQMYRSVTGYVTGNFLTSLIAAVETSLLLFILGVPFAIPLGLLVGFLDLIPLVGATMGAIVVALVALFHSLTAAVIVIVFFILYQQVENHILQPIVYSKTVQVSPLLVLISILLGAALAGILGALVAIPAAASAQILARDYFARHPVQD